MRNEIEIRTQVLTIAERILYCFESELYIMARNGCSIIPYCFLTDLVFY